MNPIFPVRPGSPRAAALTPAGSTRFEQARMRLARLAGREPEDVPDSDVIEYLAIGEAATRVFLERRLARSSS